MANQSSPVLSNILTIAFITAGCSLCINAITIRTSTPHRTFIADLPDKQHASNSFQHSFIDSPMHTGEVRKRLLERLHDVMDNKIIKRPSKRFHHYLTMARDIYPSRRSHIKSTQNENEIGTDLVPIPNHFTGVKTWSVPYSIGDRKGALFDGLVPNLNDNGDAAMDSTVKLIGNPSEIGQTIEKEAEDKFSANEYTALKDDGSLAPIIELMEGVEDIPIENYDKPFAKTILYDISKPWIDTADAEIDIPQPISSELSRYEKNHFVSPSEYHTRHIDILPIPKDPGSSGKVRLKPVIDDSVLSDNVKEAIFDNAYMASKDIESFGPIVDLTKMPVSSSKHPFSKGNWKPIPPNELGKDDLQKGKFQDGESKSLSKTVPSKVAGDKSNSQTGRRDYSDFGTFKAFSDGGTSGSDLSILQGSQNGFGKFVPDNSPFHHTPFDMFSSGEARWGTAKNRDIAPGIGDRRPDPTRPKHSMRRLENAFNSDKDDCHNIETKTCIKDEECSCYGLFRCLEGTCMSTITHTTTSPKPDLNGDDKPHVDWHDRPYTNEELGIED